MPHSYSKKQVSLMLKREQEVWIYSYADLITNLLAFFLMMLAMYKADASTAAQIRESIAKVTGGGTVAQVDSDFAQVITEFIRENKFKNQLAIQKNVEGVALTFAGGLFFETLSARLTEDAQYILEKLVPVFQKLPKSFRIDVGGHADPRPVSEHEIYPSNWELSAARAASVVRFLASKGVPPHRMRAIGYAHTQPVSKNYDENRRVVIRIGRGVVQ